MRVDQDLTLDTLAFKRDRDLAYKLYKAHNTEEHKSAFLEINRKVKRTIYRDSKSDLNRQIQGNCIFSTINSICKLNKKRDVKFEMNENEINQYFVSVRTGNKTPFTSPSMPDSIVTPEEGFKVKVIELNEFLQIANFTVFDVCVHA